MTSRTITAENPGPVTLDLTLNAGAIHIVTDPTITNASVTLTTDADNGPSADAVRDVSVRADGQDLTVRIPDVAGGGGMTVMHSGGVMMAFAGSGISVTGRDVHIHGNGRVFVNGRPVVAGDGAADGPTPIEAAVALPAGSAVQISTHVARTTIVGKVARLDYDATAGDLVAERVGELDATLSSGSVRVNEVTDTLTANLTSGNLTVGAYSGHDARLNLTSGNLALAATPRSSGRLTVHVTSGNAHLTGTAHLTVRRHVTSGHVHIS